MAARALALATLVGSVWLLAALRRRGQRFHAVDRVSQHFEGYSVASKMGDSNTSLLHAPFSIGVLDDRRQCNGTHSAHDPKYGNVIEHKDGSRSGTLQFDRRQLGRIAHQHSSIGSVGTADVARSQAAASDGRPSVAIPRAA